VAEGVHHFLICGLLEDAGCIFVTSSARQFGEVAVLDVGHRFTGKCSFEVLVGFDFWTCHLKFLSGGGFVAMDEL
jgi:hypothetical protein